MDKADWKLTVSDNGTGRLQSESPPESTGLGAALVAALAKQLKAQVSEATSAKGLSIAVTRATFDSRLPRAA
jgi:chemotaxis protein methyltransferase CheR